MHMLRVTFVTNSELVTAIGFLFMQLVCVITETLITLWFFENEILLKNCRISPATYQVPSVGWYTVYSDCNKSVVLIGTGIPIDTLFHGCYMHNVRCS